MSVSRRKALSAATLLFGYTALVAGLFGLSVAPLVGALMVLGGMALAIAAGAELVQEASHPDAPGPDQHPE